MSGRVGAAKRKERKMHIPLITSLPRECLTKHKPSPQPNELNADRRVAPNKPNEPNGPNELNELNELNAPDERLSDRPRATCCVPPTSSPVGMRLPLR